MPNIAPDSGPAPEISVEVVYAEPDHAISRAYRLAAQATLADALRLAAADPAFAGVDMAHATTGIFGIVTDSGQRLNHHDRIEVYRPLSADPKNARRARVRQARSKPHK